MLYTYNNKWLLLNSKNLSHLIQKQIEEGEGGVSNLINKAR
jgi:hypothetical protein